MKRGSAAWDCLRMPRTRFRPGSMAAFAILPKPNDCRSRSTSPNPMTRSALYATATARSPTTGRTAAFQSRLAGWAPWATSTNWASLGRGTLAIHAIHAETLEIGRLAESGAGVVHCPKSNLKLGHAIAPVREFLDAGVPVGLGTDSVASNNNVDMFEEMRLAVYLQRSRARNPRELTASDALEMATMGGARCLGLEDQLGSIEAGKLADFIVVDLTGPALNPVYDPIETIVYSAGRGNVAATFLAGKRVRIDTGPTIDDARAIAARLRHSDSSP